MTNSTTTAADYQVPTMKAIPAPDLLNLGTLGEADTPEVLLEDMTTEQLTEYINEQTQSARGYELHARRAGMALRIIKGRLDHGQWQSWLQEHFVGSARTAQRYMELSEEPIVVKPTVKSDTPMSAFRKRKAKPAPTIAPEKPTLKLYPDGDHDASWAKHLEHNAAYHQWKGLEPSVVGLIHGCQEMIIKTMKNRFRWSADRATALGIPSAQVYIDLADQWDREGFDLIRKRLKPSDIELLKQSREILDQLIAGTETDAVASVQNESDPQGDELRHLLSHGSPLLIEDTLAKAA